MTKKFFAAVAALCLSAMLSIVYAVPAYSGWRTMNQPDGTSVELRQVGDEFFHYWINRDGQTVAQNEAGYWEVTVAAEEPQVAKQRRAAVNAARRSYAQNMRKVGAGKTNMTKGIVILVNYSDVTFQSANNKAAFTSMMTDDSYSYKSDYPGSAHKYFYDQSNGQYDPQFDVYGPITLSNNRAYYGGNDSNDDDQNAAQMIYDACKGLDSQIDFSQYDLDKDGEVDFVYVFYAGNGEADSDVEDAVWPHSWYLKDGADLSLTCDGKEINLYACSSELNYNDERAGIATFCHEFSHVIGMPDYYDIDYGNNYKNGLTPMEWTLMDGGSYNGDGYCPPNYSAFDKYYMGWTTPTILNSAKSVTLTTGYTDSYQINANGSLAAYNSSATQYYIENRQQSGWDKALPGHGMLVWKVMYNQTAWDNNGPNDTNGTIRYGVLCADGAHTKSGNYWYADDGDTYPGTTSVTSINSSAPFTTYPITSIAESNNTITFKFMGGAATNYTVTWNADGVVNSTKVTDGLLTLPADPAACESEKVFVGWTLATSVDPDGKDLVLAKDGDAVEGNVTYYAVYAEEEESEAPIRKAGETSTAYTFSDKNWSSNPANGWTKNTEGAGYANSGIQFTSKNTSGNATSKTSFTNVSKVVVSYCTNAKNGAGTIDITVGTNAKTSLDVTSTGGTTARDLEFSYSTPQSGAITIGATCTTNSIYICGITIYTGGGKTYTNYSLKCSDCETKPEDIKTVTFNYNGNGQESSSFATTCSQTSTILPTPDAWLHHNCTGWFDAATAGNKVGEIGDEYEVTKDITLFAQWEESATHTVTFYNNGVVFGEPQSIYEGESIAQPETDPEVCEDYAFVGWAAEQVEEEIETKPTLVTFPATMGTVDVAYYAVYSRSEDGGSGEATILLSESFSDKESTGDSNTELTSSSYSNFSGATSKAYESMYGGLKLGSSKGVGYITSKELDLSSPFTVSMSACKYGSDAGNIEVTVGDSTKTISNSELGDAGSFDTYTLSFSAATKTSTVKIATSQKRAYIDDVVISTGSGSTTYYTTLPNCSTEPVAVTGVELDKEEAEVTVGKSITLKATISPAKATNKNVTWSSDDEDVATVVNGVVTGVAEGEATITVTTEDGGFKATCVVTVSPVKVYTVEEVKSEQGKGNISDGDYIYVKGYITSIQLKPSNFAKYGSAIIWISDTEGESKDFQLYNCYGLMGDTLATFNPYQESSTTQIDVNSVTDRGQITYALNDFIEAYGSFKLYGTTYELNSGCYITKGGKKVTTDMETLIDMPRATKRIENGHLIIEYNGIRYSITGEVIR